MTQIGKTCLIIRTEPGASFTAQKVQQLGFSPIILPAAIAVATHAKFDHSNVQAILVTSSNAPRLADFCPEALAIPVYAVGDATAAAAQEIGFQNVISAGGDASALAVLVADRLDKRHGALLHLRGTEVAGDVVGFLGACGFEVRSHIVYETALNPDFKASLRAILSANSGVILFHSPNGAQRFAANCEPEMVKNWVAIGISNAALKIFEAGLWPFVAIETAELPNENSLLQASQIYLNMP
ncbi:MAG: uroporphyrinogen-III synthase [Hyphomonadaceae bacterium]|nr:MAG: uroporphyrinogen-III synthase [Hyphomonadaceae bacterium]